MPEVAALELGVGSKPVEWSTVRHDRIKHSDYVDVAHDLNEIPWPWDDEEWEQLVAIDVFEHLDLQPQVWLDECWRILAPDGFLLMRLPAWDNPLSYRDPTHRRVFHEHTFHYWDRESLLYADFGRFYFEESARWWSVKSVSRENDDFRYLLKKDFASSGL